RQRGGRDLRRLRVGQRVGGGAGRGRGARFRAGVGRGGVAAAGGGRQQRGGGQYDQELAHRVRPVAKRTSEFSAARPALPSPDPAAPAIGHANARAASRIRRGECPPTDESMKHALLLVPALLLLAPAALAQETTTADGRRIPLLQEGIVVDGQLGDAAWQGALVQEIAYDIQPGDNTPAPVRTIVRMGYTPEALYVAFHALDPDPSKIRAHLRDRD